MPSKYVTGNGFAVGKSFPLVDDLNPQALCFLCRDALPVALAANAKRSMAHHEHQGFMRALT